ncbi:MAG TPA: malto-oligosyltrehalose synthase [Acidimicrobiales bacterium]|nr:malto-oligosyltrehalose synthase [Acidimicrobiales bacterium]
MTGSSPRRGPTYRRLGSTYRLQLRGLGFARAGQLVPYLAALGVETLYVSPVTTAAPGSTHGYDVIDPTRLDPALGPVAEFDALLAELDRHDMALLIDIVPNHMAAVAENPWWWDVLRHGPGSAFADYFDIDWAGGKGRVLLPVLGRPLSEVVADAELSVVDEGGSPALAYFDHRFPIAPGTDDRLLHALSAGRGGCSYPTMMTEVLEQQHYRLALWRLSRHEGNYRRFFDVDGLVGVRVEDPAVYRATHALFLELARDERVAGFRVDHVDGLADPAGYLTRLRHDLERAGGSRPALLVEKVLAPDERLPVRWPVDGTTGYEFADLVGSLMVDPDGAAAIAELGGRLDGDHRDFAQLSADGKRFVQRSLFPGQVERLARLVMSVTSRSLVGPDVARADVAAALVELASQLGVYRTYVDGAGATGEDRRRLRQAGAGARSHLDEDGRRALDVVMAMLVDPGHSPPAAPEPTPVPSDRLELVQRWQQHTGAVMAKGVEDTALYRFGGLLSLAEVGSDPGRAPLTVDQFHRAMGERHRRSPGSLNATTTHDTKRSEDVRARLAVLSEMPETWSALVGRWHRRHRSLPSVPHPRDEHFVYQTIVGAWPLDGDDRRAFSHRVQDYMVKALREAKVRTSWLNPDPDYERTVRSFVRTILAPSNRRFHADLDRVLGRVVPAGSVNALAWTVLKSTAPGVPDLYQGTELWSHSLVDPDNRRPVDFDRRARLLRRLDQPGPDRARAADLLASWPDGRLKLMVVQELLRLRGRHPQLFDRGAYLGLDVRGPLRHHVVAFARHRGPDWIVVVVPRLPLGVAGAGGMPVGPDLWPGTSVVTPARCPRHLVDVLTGWEPAPRRGALLVGDLFSTLPVAVLAPA